MSWSGLPEKIERYVLPEPNSGCWIWIGGIRDKKESYGGITWAGKHWRSHRLVYTLLCEEVSATLDLDHLCRNRICCNPDHLDPCTRGENIRRGVGVAPRNAKKEFCPQGHPYNTENTYFWNKQRFCRTCSDRYKHNYYARQKREKWERDFAFRELWIFPDEAN